MVDNYSTGYLQNRNYDDVFFRSVIVGGLGALRNKLKYTQVVNNVPEEHNVPVFYSMTGDEHWLKNNFERIEACYCEGEVLPAEGDFQKKPSAFLILQGQSMDTSQFTNNFVRGNYEVIEENASGHKTVRTMNSYIALMPCKMEFELRVLYDTDVMRFRLIQLIYNAFYKAQKYYITHRGMTLPCAIFLQEDFDGGIRTEYSYPNSEEYYMTFRIEIESYMPIIDETEVRFAGNRIQSFIFDFSGESATMSSVTTDSDGNEINTTLEWKSAFEDNC